MMRHVLELDIVLGVFARLRRWRWSAERKDDDLARQVSQLVRQLNDDAAASATRRSSSSSNWPVRRGIGGSIPRAAAGR